MAVIDRDAQLDQGSQSAEFGRRLLEIYTGAALSSMIAIGHQTGLFEAAAAIFVCRRAERY
ncbi:MAG TPA: hypothetical protein VKX16_01460 [Chloroflexota bacterium]|nr:hypothetical protein [Chloroflexota bacterium]